MENIGYSWLSEHYQTRAVQDFSIKSQLGSKRETLWTGRDRLETYPESYRVEPTLRGHLTFALKHEGVHLEFLTRLFKKSGLAQEVEAWVRYEPTGAYARRTGFFFEYLTSQSLAVESLHSGNYIDAIDADDYVTGLPVNVARWRVRDNLPGSPEYCPMVYRTPGIRALEVYDLPEKIRSLESDFGADLIMRSAVWLSVKESRASFQIEREQDQQDRVRRFAAVMERELGRHSNPLEEPVLINLQHGILGDSALRYGFRRSPVFVGQTQGYAPIVDYIAPHWDHISNMLSGLSLWLDRASGSAALIRAAVASFGFVYIHPMADGNGRISRFLVNDVLRRAGLVPAPLILPISAAITNSSYARADYDRVLEKFSRPLMRFYAESYRFGPIAEAADGVKYNLYFDAYQDTLPAWRYPDFTDHVSYLGSIIETTVSDEMRGEAALLRANDLARQLIKEFFEAPNADLDAVIRSVQQTGYTLSNSLKKRYPVFAERPELGEQIISAVKEAFMSIEAKKNQS